VWSLENGEPGVPSRLTGLFRDFHGVLADSPLITIDCSSPPPACPGDLNGDVTVNFADITHALSNWTRPYTFASITQVLSNWGAACR
jgi:hypothetical protein